MSRLVQEKKNSAAQAVIVQDCKQKISETVNYCNNIFYYNNIAAQNIINKLNQSYSFTISKVIAEFN